MNQISIDARILYTREDVQALLLNRGKIILITEDIPDYLRDPMLGTSCLTAASLLPDYGCISYYLDNNQQGFAASYEDYLHNPDCSLYFATMISAMINGIPLGFVFGTEEIEVMATGYLLDFMARNYGLLISPDPKVVSYMDSKFIPSNVTILYSYGLLTGPEFLLLYPGNMLIDPYALQKLILELRPPLRNPSDTEEAQKYFMEYCIAAKQVNTPKVLVDPFTMI